jgi:hypothetical protein
LFQADSTALSLMAPWTHWAWAVWERERQGEPTALAPPSQPLHADVASGSGLGGLVSLALKHVHDPRAALLSRTGTSVLAANVMRRAQFQTLARALDAKALRWCLIKGGAFTAQFPEWLPHRQMTDLDVLVDPVHIETAMQVLRDLGYIRVDGTGSLVGAWAAASTWQRREHTLLELDLHGRLHHPPLLAGMEQSVLAERVHGQGLVWADPVWSVVIAAVHRARSGYRNAASELLDVAVWTRSWTEPQWRQLWSHAETWTLQLPVMALLWGCAAWLNPTHIRQSIQWLDPAGRHERTARAMAEGRWRTGHDGSGVLPMAKLYAPFAMAAVHAPGRRAMQSGARLSTAFVVHGVLRSTDALFRRGN